MHELSLEKNDDGESDGEEEEGEEEGEETEDDDDNGEIAEDSDGTESQSSGDDKEIENGVEREGDIVQESDDSEGASDGDRRPQKEKGKVKKRTGESKPKVDNSEEAIRLKVTKDVEKEHLRHKAKYNSKSSLRRVGRPKGSKAKQDNRVNLKTTDGWD